MVTRRGVALTLVSQTFADILREVTRPLRRRVPDSAFVSTPCVAG